MAIQKHKVGRTGLRTQAVGLIIDRPNDFFKEICSALQKTLDLRHARTECHQVGSREVRYVCEANPVHVNGLGKPLLALPLHSSEKQSAWLVVEVEYEAGRPALLQQVSLKVLQGPTTDTATLCFRAEWDMRDRASNHAQPHWNVHMPGLVARVAEVQQVEENFSEFAKRQEEGTFASFAAENDRSLAQAASASSSAAFPDRSAASGFTSEQMHRFHFAMAVDWHGKTGMHSPALPNPDQMVQWIAECAKYVRGQLAFMA
ncbi:MAG: hypothetical protein Q8L44_14415 [Sulfuritalea sp.]|nr:hypothetical protein [Sulfuritalea sp.]